MRSSQILIALFLMASLSGCVAEDGDDDTQDTDGTTETVDDDNETVEAPSEQDIEVALSGAYPVNIAYAPPTITVDNNTLVNLTFTNNDQAPVFSHDWVLEGYEDTASTDIIDNGETSTVTFLTPPPGTYAFYCSVSGHRDNGMEGEFIVNA